MKRQEIFDTVAKHLLKQNKKAHKKLSRSEAWVCVYLAPDGCRCAAGCLIPAEIYNPRWEGASIRELTFFTEEVCEGDSQALRLLSALQRIHDYFYPDEWRDKLINLAKQYFLDYSVCQTATDQ